MKRIIIVFAALSLVFASCSKDKPSSTNNGNGNGNTNPTSTASYFKWTYLGTEFHSDTTNAYAADSLTSLYTINALQGDLWTPTGGFVIQLHSFAPGSYSDQGNSFRSANHSDDVAPFTLTISSNANNMVSGTFNGTYQGTSITGSFGNIRILN
ncbi:MAG: hypothetical protein JST83_08635 [Bacteroidetes bacterium]|nr:hypothetical protein [Bacteroidota bacterium]